MTDPRLFYLMLADNSVILTCVHTDVNGCRIDHVTLTQVTPEQLVEGVDFRLRRTEFIHVA